MMEKNGTEGLSGLVEARFGWDAFPRQYSWGGIGGLLGGTTALDCDAAAVFCGGDGRPLSDDRRACCVSWDNPELFGGAAVHGGDNRTGEGLDDETIRLDLDRIPGETESVLLTLDLFKERRHNGRDRVQSTFVRLVDPETGEELDRCDFTALGAGARLVTAARLCRKDGAWRFEPLGRPSSARDRQAYLRELAAGTGR